MLLFSTLLEIKDSVTPDDFIRLVLKWNETSSHKENRVSGIDWQGEYNVRYGTDHLWLEFTALEEKNIIAVRHEKVTEDGVVWDSDFVVNFTERRIAIQLDRTYNEDALIMDAAFSTPHFITLLIEEGFLKDDLDLPVLRTPIYITDEDADLYQNIFNGCKTYRLPIVFVSKTAENTDPLSITWLASRLKGAAHVLVEESVDGCRDIRNRFLKAGNLYGAVRIRYPSETTGKKKIYFRSASGDTDVRLERVIRNVIQYGIAQRIDRLYTWQGVVSAVLNENLERQIRIRMSAEHDRQPSPQNSGRTCDWR